MADFTDSFDRTLNYNELHTEAVEAVDRSNKTYQQIADELNVSISSVSRALRTVGPKYQSLQCRIIENETGQTVNKQTIFLVSRG